MQYRFKDAQVPAANSLMGGGRGFEVSLLRLGRDRIYHFMRSLGAAERAIDVMVDCGIAREAFGQKLISLSKDMEVVSPACVEVEAVRLMMLRASRPVDRVLAIAVTAIAPEKCCNTIDEAIEMRCAAGISQWLPLADKWHAQRSLCPADTPDEIHHRSWAAPRSLARQPRRMSEPLANPRSAARDPPDPYPRTKDTMKIESLFSVAGKVALVTGGSRGIGEMIAAGYLANGAKVYISSRKAAACDATAVRLTEQLGGECISLPADVAKLTGVAELVAELGRREGRLDVLVNNAGVAWGESLDEFPELGWDKVMDTNVKGAFFLTQRLLPLLEAGATSDDPARVINIGSTDGIKNNTSTLAFSYGPSKAAVHALTRLLALHLAPRNIIVNGIAPGPFPTWMLSTAVGGGGDVEHTDWDAVGQRNPRGRVGTPEDIAGLAIFLSSRAGAFTVGEVVSCDGGTLLT